MRELPVSSSREPQDAALRSPTRSAERSTFWVGKPHLVPIAEWPAGATKNWPLGQGYDQFHGSTGETNNWYPSLADGSRYIDQPYLPEDGYRLSKGPVDKRCG